MTAPSSLDLAPAFRRALPRLRDADHAGRNVQPLGRRKRILGLFTQELFTVEQVAADRQILQTADKRLEPFDRIRHRNGPIGVGYDSHGEIHFGGATHSADQLGIV